MKKSYAVLGTSTMMDLFPVCEALSYATKLGHSVLVSTKNAVLVSTKIFVANIPRLSFLVQCYLASFQPKQGSGCTWEPAFFWTHGTATAKELWMCVSLRL